MKPPRLADWLLARMLPEGKRGDSMRGDLLEEFSRLPDSGSRTPRLWYWQQTIRLTVRYLFSPSPQDRLSCPRRAPMWFDLLGDVKTAVRAIVRVSSALEITGRAVALQAGDRHEVIPVMNPETRQTRRGRVVGPGEVEMIDAR